MTSKKIPPDLTPKVRAQLQREKDRIAAKPRERGQAGSVRDRTLEYLELMLTSTSTKPKDHGSEAEEGHLVSVRYQGDVEHRTYHLSEARDPEGATDLPPSWNLGQALLGRRDGETVSYRHEGKDFRLTVLAVWDAEETSQDLPETPGEQVHGGPRAGQSEEGREGER